MKDSTNGKNSIRAPKIQRLDLGVIVFGRNDIN
jgi:hypothetical protein